MAPRGQVVNIVGGDKLRKAFRGAAGGAPLLDALRESRRQVAQVVVDVAVPRVPVLTGRLRRSVRALASQKTSRAVAGSAAVDYAPPIHWGRKKGGVIEGRPFLWDAAQQVQADEKTADTFAREIDGMWRDLLRGVTAWTTTS